MDKGLSGKTIPEAPKPKAKGFQGGVMQGFPTTKGASKNEVCPKCGCYCDGMDCCKKR